MNDETSVLDNFCGTARLFPLPNVVLYPHVLQPLHIFEPRYRQMTADALASDRLLAVALLQTGWEGEYQGKPAIHPMVCLTHIEAEQRLEDGRYNLCVRGVKRARVRHEIESGKLYRIADVDLVGEGPPPSAGVIASLRKQLGELALPWFPPQGPAVEHLQKMLKAELPLGILSDLLAFSVPLALQAKQELLDELDPERRARSLIGFLSGKSPAVPPDPSPRKFPPGFSSN